MKIENLTKDEKSLLLFFETCEVDNSCIVNTLHMNDKDFEIAKKWNENGFVTFKRMPMAYIQYLFPRNINKTHYVILSEEATKMANLLRQERAKRMRNRFLTEILPKYVNEPAFADIEELKKRDSK